MAEKIWFTQVLDLKKQTTTSSIKHDKQAYDRGSGLLYAPDQK